MSNMSIAVMTTTRPINSEDLIKILHLLNEKFGPGYRFSIEHSAEGGINMADWPGRPADQPYGSKFARNQFNGESWTLASVWPKNVGKKCMINAGALGGLLFKTFYNAPVWTPEERAKVLEVFTEMGFKVKGQF